MTNEFFYTPRRDNCRYTGIFDPSSRQLIFYFQGMQRSDQVDFQEWHAPVVKRFEQRVACDCQFHSAVGEPAVIELDASPDSLN